MLQFLKSKKVFLFTAALGIMSFAAYGIYNVANAIAATGQAITSGDNPVSINTLFPPGDKLDSGICSPFGCAGCNGCSSPLYQQETKIVYEPFSIE
jgi:hypothetical protein